MLRARNLARFEWLIHGFGFRDSDDPGPVSTLKQIHSAVVLEARRPASDRFAEGDGLVTATPGLMVGVRTADCVPVLIADERTHAVAAVHAGWRGSAGNIAGTALRELITRFGSRTEDLHAAIGPAIGPCCYEVSADVARRFEEWRPDWAVGEQPRKIDLPGVNEAQLREAGVRDIWMAGECTFCLAERYFSFRREKEQAGRMMSLIGST